MKKNIIFVIILVMAIALLLVFFLNRDDSSSVLIENYPSQTANETLPEQVSSAEEQLEEHPTEQATPNEPKQTETKPENTQNENKEPSATETKPAANESFIKQNIISWGFAKSSSRKIDTVIVHSSYDALGDDPFDAKGVIEEYKLYEVSAHYLIARNGDVYQLVKDDNIAYHAGVSSVPDGRTNVNNFSIGIEIINTKEDKPTKDQYKSLNKLIAVLKDKYKIKYILGHDEIAPERKDDPWNLDWSKIEAR